MLSISTLISKLRDDHPGILFAAGTEFRWDPLERTVYVDVNSDDAPALLHETAHGLLEHNNYRRDLELLRLEREAWSYAKTVLAPKYTVEVSDDTIQDALDTYRDWLHARSNCPDCAATGYQSAPTEYTCPSCHTTWLVNDARSCELRRIRIK